ncbi:TnsA-like heteromeric transposase endonuclease subunit [Paenibacillus sp. TRM 82003]|uniref:TnsA-like heteromeric transposase endonuclease subunit n=1 Tax=Kineococcus sp. TRM81007 TaxID=2925831 RepID=UPI001F55E335|nr:TnsA-like heteromeric transposase endonuclease subunit [Kineococcus sp. TRM81007]MCI2239105.1 TnsA-like heteromeric transposase endonuclease subunit [Kineococcus sp. TRM81007]MCI3924524.1 TnsA-like heteromeric transposase endonuclease subunit [Paenibacillus sp. TRM 82003]
MDVDTTCPDRLCYVANDGTASIATPSVAVTITFEDVDPVRSFPTWPHKRSYDGWWWSASTSRHIGYESWLERDHLMLFDHDPDVIGIASQPFWIIFDGDAHGERDAWHAPDYFLRLRDGSAVVVDVRARARLDPVSERTFERTRRLCRQLGWQYRVCSDIEAVHVRNVRWLSGYRHPRFGSDEEKSTKLLDVFEAPLPLADGLTACGSNLHWRAVLYHLLWRRVLTYEQHLPLSDASLITTAIDAPGAGR